MKALGTSVYTTSGYLNGADAKHPGLAAGLTKVASGAHKLADGVTTAAAKGSAIPTGAAAAASGSDKLASGAKKLSKVDKMIDKAVKKALPKAYEKALQKVAFERNLSVKDGVLAVNWADPVQRWAMVDQLTPTLVTAIKAGDTGDASVKTDGSTSDTSFLDRCRSEADETVHGGLQRLGGHHLLGGPRRDAGGLRDRLVLPVPPLRTRSALQEKSDNAALEAMS